jgi:hypothetical protein
LTDASDRFYAGLVTQIQEEQLDLPMEEQDHQPLAFLSGEFKGVQQRWTVPEKKGFAIVDTVTMQVLTGNAETTALALMLRDNVPVNAPLYFFNAQNLMEVEKLSKAMTEIHTQVADKATRDRKAAIQKHNDKTHVRSPNFQVGDYLLVVEHRKSGMSKLQVEWKGPRCVASVEFDYVFAVTNLIMKGLKAAHATRLRFHKDMELNVTANLAQAAEHNYHQLYYSAARTNVVVIGMSTITVV